MESKETSQAKEVNAGKKKVGRKAIEVNVQHTVEELRKYYLESKCVVERRRVQVVTWTIEGKSRKEVKELSGYHSPRILAIIKRYNDEGLTGLKDKRHEGAGAPRLLSDEEMLFFAQEVRKDYEEGIMWSGKKVVEWVKEELGKEIYLSRGYEMLGAIGFSAQRVRPRHVKGDSEFV